MLIMGVQASASRYVEVQNFSTSPDMPPPSKVMLLAAVLLHCIGEQIAGCMCWRL